MANIINDEITEYVGILAKLEPSDEEGGATKEGMGRTLGCIDRLNEPDTSDMESMSHVFPMTSVLREGVAINRDEHDNIPAGAPEQKGGVFKVPKTVEQEGEDNRYT